MSGIEAQKMTLPSFKVFLLTTSIVFICQAIISAFARTCLKLPAKAKQTTY